MNENNCNNTYACSSNNNRTTSNSLRVPATASATAKHQQQMNLAAIQKPRASYPEIMNPRLSLNGTLRHLVPSPRPLYRDHSSRSIHPLTANEQQMSELDGSFYGNIIHSSGRGSGGGGSIGGGGYLNASNNMMGNDGGVGSDIGLIDLSTSNVGIMTTTTSLDYNSVGGGAGGSGTGDFNSSTGGGGVHFHTTELSITPSMTGDEQCIDLGSLRRFSIDRHSFLGKSLLVCLCTCLFIFIVFSCIFFCQLFLVILNCFFSFLLTNICNFPSSVQRLCH